MEEEIKRLKSVEEEFDVYRNKFDLLLKDKMNMEKYNIKQEQNISIFSHGTIFINIKI